MVLTGTVDDKGNVVLCQPAVVAVGAGHWAEFYGLGGLILQPGSLGRLWRTSSIGLSERINRSRLRRQKRTLLTTRPRMRVGHQRDTDVRRMQRL